MKTEEVKMGAEEWRKLEVIKKVIKREMTQRKAASLIGLSIRQIKRMVKRVRKEGMNGIIHRLRGKPSVRRTPEELKEKVITLYQERYMGFGPTLAQEKLLELNEVSLSKETLRKWLLKESLWKKERKSRKHRYWRERKAYLGEMVQMDGSHHDWLEGKGPELVLMAYIDDATNTAFARFYNYEGVFPAMDSFKQYVKYYGIPQSLYLDRHSTYKSTEKLTIEEELEGKRKPKSQFERAMDELGVDVLHANSPQAKGRIERLFRTFQDRVIKEMRLVGISTKEEANRFLEGYLPSYNKKFGKLPLNMANLHREIPAGINLDSILSIKTKRVLRNDWTIAHNNQLYQIKETPPDTRIKAVMVEERVDGTIHITYNNLEIKYKKIERRQLKTKEEIPIKLKKTYIPLPDHPWRRFKINPYKHKQTEKKVSFD